MHITASVGNPFPIQCTLYICHRGSSQTIWDNVIDCSVTTYSRVDGFSLSEVYPTTPSNILFQLLHGDFSRRPRSSSPLEKFVGPPLTLTILNKSQQFLIIPPTPDETWPVQICQCLCSLCISTCPVLMLCLYCVHLFLSAAIYGERGNKGADYLLQNITHKLNEEKQQGQQTST